MSDATNGRAVSGGTVSVTSGPNANLSSSTDASGAYSIAGLLAGSIGLHASAPVYDAADKTVSVQADTRVDFALRPMVVSSPQCDASLWNHVHDVKRLEVVKPCQTVTGVIATHHSSDDGDIDMELAVDPPFANVLNQGNISKLNGHLQIEAVCQAPIHPDVPDAFRACKDFTGSVPIPAIGTHVQVTGHYVIDHDHGWMEIHPISVLTVAP
jgi:carboxypeptidase family protein